MISPNIVQYTLDGEGGCLFLSIEGELCITQVLDLVADDIHHVNVKQHVSKDEDFGQLGSLRIEPLMEKGPVSKHIAVDDAPRVVFDSVRIVSEREIHIQDFWIFVGKANDSFLLICLMKSHLGRTQ
jgi:hypothetical protein